ncbi:MAG: tRNA (adenosine(37)-N6)-threonylcarbamoyltransferase complex transferase subunit TsaD [bacterium]|nr:tRNA (adenosine(37)-N6)-threonylcarbamoyltransferase complex transferase subunit TsaD [bacterium]
MNQPKIILGIETSCDETSAAVVEIPTSGKPLADKGVKILSNVVASSASLQAKYGGVIPEQAAREQLKSIIPVLQESLQVAGYSGEDIDALAVTQGPGLIGSLLVGVETAKVLATVWNKPLVPINHLLGHFYANWMTVHLPGEIQHNPNTHPEGVTPAFPILGLLVSGGHTDLVLFKDHGKYQYLGGTRDDAAGECFDKCARLLNLPYPGGPQISQAAEKGNPQAFSLPRPMLDSEDWDFSFSGLKTAVANIITDSKQQGVTQKRPEQFIQDLAASIQEAITDVLVIKTTKAAQSYKVKQIMLAGGVAANRRLAEKIVTVASSKIGNVKIFIPPANLCTDNAAYIAAAALYNYHPVDPLTLQANPNLSLLTAALK